MHNFISHFPTVINQRVLDIVENKKNITLSGSGNFSAKAFTFADVYRDQKQLHNILWIVNDVVEQDHIAHALEFWTDLPVHQYAVIHGESTNVRDTEYRNRISDIEYIWRLGKKEPKVLVMTYPDALKKFPSLKELEARTFTLKKHQKVNVTELFEHLIDIGYQITDSGSLRKGMYYKHGEVLTVFPIGSDFPVRIVIGFQEIEAIYVFNPETKETTQEIEEVEIVPAAYEQLSASITDFFDQHTLLVEDEVDIIDEHYEAWNELFDKVYDTISSLSFVSFNEDDNQHLHLHYLSVIKYRGSYDLINDFRDKQRDQWQILLFTKDFEQAKAVFEDNNMAFSTDPSLLGKQRGLFVFALDKEEISPASFQNPQLQLLLLTDKDISFLREDKKRHVSQKAYLDFLTSLKTNDYVVHVHHGIGRFLGLEKRTVDDVTREYLKIGYAENDKLFVPIDQADKVNKFIGADDQPPRLTRLGSAEWNTITRKVQKETEAIARELLKLYAERKNAKAFVAKGDDKAQQLFEEKFPYEETPGQVKAILDVKADMEKNIPMDRLVCGDVGFGKTEVAMRAAFKAVQNRKQVALISPITILADQHYRSFKKRMEDFDIRIELLSRFRTQAEQKDVLRRLERGEVDIVIGTHRLLQPDLKFKDLGLVIVDEEQRFGVKQKEAFKKLKREVHMLTLTATPIPRTLNIALNKLRDISTITTPPPGRLPIITEVRRFSQELIREVILREISRGGQVYFLHNRVQTIDGMADKLRALVPEARFGVAHGKLGSGDLEERILAFKDHKFDVLVSSTIIENGIDLANANTLIVNNAERLGLAQLYQLRGRVGRGKTQAYAYFLYHGQRLKLDAKKRLRAIVEASELGSGFQIAMKDLEIRGAGDILGAKQHGSINVVGVSHFIRMLNKAVEDLKAGSVVREEEPEDVSIELPLTAYIPDTYIVNSKEKINVYQKLSSADTLEYLAEIREEIIEDYGKMPVEVLNLFRILEIKILARKAKLVSVKVEGIGFQAKKEIVLHMSNLVKPENIMNVLEHNPKWYISGSKLRIKVEDLGLHWFDDLRDSVKQLGQELKVTEPTVVKSK